MTLFLIGGFFRLLLRVVGVSYLFLCMYLFDGGGVGGSEGRSGSSLSGCVVFSLALALNVFFFLISSFLFFSFRGSCFADTHHVYENFVLAGTG